MSFSAKSQKWSNSMKKVLMAMFLSVMALGLTVGDAEARRLGVAFIALPA